MNAFDVITEGVAATLLMTAFVYSTKYITHQRLGVVRILGSMITGRKGEDGRPSSAPYVILTGGFAHYLVGVLFSFLFNSVWDAGWVRADVLHCLDLGIIAGLFAIVTWRVFFALHPCPPQIRLSLYLTIIFTGHLFFGVGMYLTRTLIGG